MGRIVCGSAPKRSPSAVSPEAPRREQAGALLAMENRATTTSRESARVRLTIPGIAKGANIELSPPK
jgi:hypothetical protein